MQYYFRLWPMFPRTKSLGSSVPWTMRTLDDASLWQCVPWTMIPLVDASLGQRVPDRCVPTLWDRLTLWWDRICRTVAILGKVRDCLPRKIPWCDSMWLVARLLNQWTPELQKVQTWEISFKGGRLPIFILRIFCCLRTGQKSRLYGFAGSEPPPPPPKLTSADAHTMPNTDNLGPLSKTIYLYLPKRNIDCSTYNLNTLILTQ